MVTSCMFDEDINYSLYHFGAGVFYVSVYVRALISQLASDRLITSIQEHKVKENSFVIFIVIVVIVKSKHNLSNLDSKTVEPDLNN